MYVIKFSGRIGKKADELSAAWFREELRKAAGDSIRIDVNSDGGSVLVGKEIRQEIVDYTGIITARIVGNAASMASDICTVCDQTIVTPQSVWMMHKCNSGTTGNSDDMRKMCEILDGIDQQMAEDYSRKSGKSVDECLDLMKTETWLFSQEIIDAGFADSIEDETDENEVTTDKESAFAVAKQKFHAAWRLPDNQEIAAYLHQDPEEEARVQAIRRMMKQQPYNLELQEAGEKAIRDKTPHFVAQTQMFVKMRDFGLSDEDKAMCKTMNLTESEYWKHNFRPVKY